MRCGQRGRSAADPRGETIEAAGAFAMLIDMVPGDVSAEIACCPAIFAVRIGAGKDCTF